MTMETWGAVAGAGMKGGGHRTYHGRPGPSHAPPAAGARSAGRGAITGESPASPPECFAVDRTTSTAPGGGADGNVIERAKELDFEQRSRLRSLRRVTLTL